MNKRNINDTYTEFIESGGEVFPKNMYPTRHFSMGKIKYTQVEYESNKLS